ncbi:hypothetical protein [Brevibacterium luteolum]|uniref:hypothetical protein n=1 Tax=Brevibacterium luteolum TaxID=199591 RepID=UPI003B66D875
MSQLSRLIRDIDRIKAQIASAASTPQLAHSSIENGSIDSYDADGNLRLRIGEQPDGTQTVTVVDGPVPPAPSPPVVAVDGPVLTVSWDGTLADPSVALPADFARIHVHLSQTADMSSAPVRASIEARAGASTVTAVETAGTWWVALAVEAQSGRRSPLSVPVEAVVSLVNLDGALEAVRESANGKNSVTFSAEPPPSAYAGTAGDVWWQTTPHPDDESRSQLIGQWVWAGGQWVQQELSHQVIASVDLGKATVGELDGARIAFGSASGDILKVGALDGVTVRGMQIIGGELQAGEGVRITGEAGIEIRDKDGILTTRLPADGSRSVFTGDVAARSLTAMGPLTMHAPGNRIESGAGMILESGVVEPLTPPTVSPHWIQYPFPPLGDGETASGLTYAAGLWWRHIDVHGTDTGDRLEGYALAAGQLTFQRSFPVQVGTRVNGITAIGDELFVLGVKHGVPITRRHVVVYNAVTGVFVREWEYPSYGTGHYQPGIGTDGTNILIGQCWKNSGELTVRTYTPAGILVSQLDTGDLFRNHVTGVYQGTADFGTPRFVVGKGGDDHPAKRLPVFTVQGEYVPGQSWQTPNSRAAAGFTFVDRMWWSVSGDGVLSQYSEAGITTAGGDDQDDWWLALTWKRLGGAETRLGPATRFLWPRRASIKAETHDPPAGVNAVYAYFAKKTTTPARTDFHYGGGLTRNG